MKYIIPCLIFFTAFACADDFSSRAKAGNDASKTDQGKKYEASYDHFIDQAMRICIPPGSEFSSDNRRFVFVGHVNMAGQLTDVEVIPVINVSACFAGEFSTYNLPAPPQENSTSFGYPITITISIW